MHDQGGQTSWECCLREADAAGLAINEGLLSSRGCQAPEEVSEGLQETHFEA